MRSFATLCFISAVLLLGATPRASAQLVVTAPVLEVQSGFQTFLQSSMQALSATANGLVSEGVGQQALTATATTKNLALAKSWYDGLMAISDAVRDYRRVQLIFTKQGFIIRQYSDGIELIRKSPYLTPTQILEISTVYAKLLKESINTLDDLGTVTSPAMLKMTDAERMRFIDQLDAKITDQANLIDYFTRRNRVLIQAGEQTAQDIQSLRALMGVK